MDIDLPGLSVHLPHRRAAVPISPETCDITRSRRRLHLRAARAEVPCAALRSRGSGIASARKGYALAPKGIVRAHGVVQAQLDRGKAYPVDMALRFCSAALLQ